MCITSTTMKVYIAEEAGFCFGVKRALNIINELNEKKHDIHVYGQLIHNKTTLDRLKSQNIGTIDTLDRLDPDKHLVIRTHGIPEHEEACLKAGDIGYTDATCPLVKKLHRIIDSIDTQKNHIVIVGDKHHPEIIAAKSYAPEATVVHSDEDVAAMSKHAGIGVVAQTTLDTDHFKHMVSLLLDKAHRLEIHNTICEATKVRQQAVKKLAKTVDCMVVVGSKNSSNTRKLYNIAQERNPHTFYVESGDDLVRSGALEKMKHFQSAGVTAGASTPPEEINKVEEILKNINRVKESNNGQRKRYPDH